MKLHHVGIVVKDIARATPWFEEQCGYRAASDVIHDPIQKVRVQFFEHRDGSRIELIEPAAEDSPVSRTLQKQGGGVNHLCYEVHDLDGTLERMRAAGAFPTRSPQPAAAFGGRRITFVLTPDRALIELLESDQQPS